MASAVGDMIIEARDWKGQEPRNRSLQNLKNTRKWIFFLIPPEQTSLDLDFSPVKLLLNFQPPEL